MAKSSSPGQPSPPEAGGSGVMVAKVYVSSTMADLTEERRAAHPPWPFRSSRVRGWPPRGSHARLSVPCG